MRYNPKTAKTCPGRKAKASRRLSAASIRAIAFCVIVGALLAGCADRTGYYAVGTPVQKDELKELFRLLSLEKKPDEKRFVVMRQIADELLSMGQYEKLCNFLTTYVEKNRDDAYDAYYLLMVANVYGLQGALPFAEYYYARIVNNYRDLLIEGASIHESCLNELIRLASNPEQKVLYYRQVISRFPKSTNLGYAYFMLGKTYEQLGEWDLAVKAYGDFRPFYNTTIPNFPDASAYAKGIVDFFNSSKDWTFEKLTDLVAAVKSAMEAGSAYRLSRLKAKVNFFAMSWEKKEEDTNDLVEFSFAPFMDSGRIFFEDSLDKDSNSREAFLKTWGWTLRLSPWYLYFRKINFPADPEIHGRWEWAGIYFGEKH